MTKKFDARNAEKSRAVCEAMAERADTGKRVLTERERRILDMWPRFEDGEPVWFGDAVANLSGAITVEAIEFSRGMVCVKDAEDGDWSTSIRALHPLKRPASKVLDADGVEIKVGDTVYGIGRTKHRFEVIDPHHIDPGVGEAFSVRCYDRDEHEECHCKPKLLTHTRPDSWRRLEEDAEKNACDYFGVECDSEAKCRMCPHFQDDRDCSLDMNADLIRRAKALAGAEAGR